MMMTTTTITSHQFSVTHKDIDDNAGKYEDDGKEYHDGEEDNNG